MAGAATKATAMVMMASLLATSGLKAQEEAEDESTTELSAVEITAAARKETIAPGVSAAQVSILGRENLNGMLATDLKFLSSNIPNMSNPEYGSRTTSAIYIRGMGSRMDQPAVGLYVDGIPYMNKSAFDISLNSIERISIMRGPQGTLYGRNTMAGIIDITTQQPDTTTRSTTLQAGAGNHNKVDALASHFDHIGRVGIAATAYYHQRDGYFENEYNGKEIDDDQNAGGRLNLTYGRGRVRTQATLSYDHSDQKGYPYSQLDSLGREQGICYNRESSYRRDLLTAGVYVEYRFGKTMLTSATSVQRLDDDMHLDNDFTKRDIFDMAQKQKETDWTEEIIYRTTPNSGSRYRHVSGASVFGRKMDIDAPVKIMSDGIEDLIESKVNNVAVLKQMGMSLDITNQELPIGTEMKHPATGAALFHQSGYDINGHLTAEIGLRADYEKSELDYKSQTMTHYTFSPMVREEQDVPTDLGGSLSQDWWEVLPKVTLKWRIDEKKDDRTIYLSVAKGYKSGGYNTQMMSDILQYQTQKDLKQNLYDHIPKNVAIAQQLMKPILTGMPEVDSKAVLAYDPEYSWNYEVGTHLKIGQASLDAAVFYIDCQDQQIAVFSDLGGMGRMMRNAGRTQSYGAELSMRYHPTQWLCLFGQWGYTHATFRRYTVSDSISYKGNHVPYAPSHTFGLGAATNWQMDGKAGLARLGATVNLTGASQIYWNETNQDKQGTYAQLSACINATPRRWTWLTLTLWGKNLTDSDFNTFYFESMGNKFVQKCKPIQVGVSAKAYF